MNLSKGMKLAFLTTLISGVSIFVNKFGVSLVSPALLYTTIKNTLVGIVVLSIIMGARKLSEIKSLNKLEWLKLIGIGIIGGSLPFYLFFEGLSKTSAINAAMIHKSLVLWVALLAGPYLKEKLSTNQIVAVVMIYLSNLLIGGFSGFSFSLSELMILGATILWAVENVVAKKTLKTVSAELVTFFRMGFGSLILWIMAWSSGVRFENLTSLSFMNWSVILLVSGLLFSYVWTWYQALKHEKAVVVSSILVGSTLVTNTLSGVFLSSGLDKIKIIQFGLILLGLSVFLWEEKRKNKVFS